LYHLAVELELLFLQVTLDIQLQQIHTVDTQQHLADQAAEILLTNFILQPDKVMLEVILLQKETMVEFKRDLRVLVYQLNQQLEVAEDLVP
tara:strand:+ start:483 stop:755 length:273 start_codon:yes stop_codon:yes gene_type:complete